MGLTVHLAAYAAEQDWEVRVFERKVALKRRGPPPGPTAAVSGGVADGKVRLVIEGLLGTLLVLIALAFLMIRAAPGGPPLTQEALRLGWKVTHFNRGKTAADGVEGGEPREEGDDDLHRACPFR